MPWQRRAIIIALFTAAAATLIATSSITLQLGSVAPIPHQSAQDAPPAQPPQPSASLWYPSGPHSLQASQALADLASTSGVCPAECNCARSGRPRKGVMKASTQEQRCRGLGTVAEYLARVYPSARERLLTMAPDKVRSFYDSLHFFYDLGCDLVGGCKEPGIVLRWLYEPILPCTVRTSQPNAPDAAQCLRAHFHFRPEWARQLPEWMEVEHRALGLGLPIESLPNAGRTGSEFASDFMDAGAASMWFIYRRGSGIFYKMGRTKTAPGKNAMVHALLCELFEAGIPDAAWRQFVLREKLMEATHGALADAERIRATANGSATCVDAQVRSCRCRYILGDDWDNVMVWLARRLGYETLFFTATLLPPNGCAHTIPHTKLKVPDDDLYFVTAYAELADVRPLNEAMIKDQEAGQSRWLIKDGRAERAHAIYTLRKRRNVGERWMDQIKNSKRLTLRDPFALDANESVQPCNFSVRDSILKCSSHISSQLPRDGFGRCGLVMCGQLGAWVRGRQPSAPTTSGPHTPSRLMNPSPRDQLLLGGPEATTLATQDAKDVRRYLNAVYPTARFSQHSTASLLALFDSLHFYYASSLTPGRLERGDTTSVGGMPLNSTHSYTCVKPPAGLGLTRDRFHGLLPCPPTKLDTIGGRGGCLEHVSRHALDLEWARNLSDQSWIEVQHAAFGNKLSVDPNVTDFGWADFMDPGPAGMWYHYARGSGVFYYAGRTLLTPSKGLALATMLHEVGGERTSRAAHTVRALAQDERRYFSRFLSGRSAKALADRVYAAATGSNTCLKLGINYCRDNFTLGDEWDAPIVLLARALNYDTIFFVASLCCSMLPQDVCGVSELVDLRTPTGTRFERQLNQTLGLSIPVHAERKPADVAAAWISYLQRSSVLTLRDPLDIRNDARALPCTFRPSAWLSCAGHPSTMLENVSSSG